MNEVSLIMPFADMERLAVSIAKSGMFGMKTPEQALVLMMISQAEGRHPALAARDYDIVQGRPTKKAEAMLRDFLQGGGRVEWHALTDESADATFSHAQGGSARISWDMKRAAAAGLGGKDMWKRFPRQMLRSRTVSEGVRTVWPMATSGMYVPEEQTDQFTGQTIEVEPPVAIVPPASRDRQAINEAVLIHADPPTDKYADPDKRAAWLVKFRAALATTTTAAAVEKIAEGKVVLDFLDWCRANSPTEAREVTSALAQAYGRHAAPGVQEPDDFDEDTGEIHIRGEEKLAAG